MGNKSPKNREIKKKKKDTGTPANAPVLQSVVTQQQPEVITKIKKVK